MAIWEAFLTPKLIASRLRPSKNQITLISYQPNLSRQLSLIQLMLKSLYDRKSSLFLYSMWFTKDECDKHLSLYAEVVKLTPISFRPSFYYKQEYNNWWRNYYTNEIFDVFSLTQYLIYDFTSIQDKCKKGITTLIKEIRAFQENFETSYRPDDFSRTIREEAFILKDKFLEKLPSLKIPSCVKLGNKYELDFKLQPPKFPRLPSSNPGLEFGPPFP